MLNNKKSRKKQQNIERLIIIIVSFVLLCVTSLDAHDVGKKTDLRFWAVDVGQGDCMFFMFPNGKNMLIDAGTAKSKKQIERFLNQHLDNGKTIDLCVATHHHSDHIGSMSTVIGKYNVKEVWDNGSIHGSSLQKKFYKAVNKRKVRYKKVLAGYKEENKFGDVKISVLAPCDNNCNGLNENNRSIVLLVSYKKVSFLLTGDMEELERNTFKIPQATILKIAHHGSRSGTNLQFLRQVRPAVVLLSYGKNNPYGHPHKEVLDAIKEYDKELTFDKSMWYCQSPASVDIEQNLIRLDAVDGNICIATDGETYIQDNRNNYLETRGIKTNIVRWITCQWKRFLRYIES